MKIFSLENLTALRDMVTWGRQLAEARSTFSAWWLARFSGLAIFITVTIFILIGDGLTEAME